MLYNFNPDLALKGKNPLSIKSKKPKMSVRDALMKENRFRLVAKNNPTQYEDLLRLEEADIKRRWRLYQALASIDYKLDEE